MFKNVESKFRYLKPSKVKKFPPAMRPKTPEAIKKLLTPIDNLEVPTDESDSEISDIFEEYHKDSYFAKKVNGKPISKREADWLTMDKFSDLYKDIVKKIKNEKKEEKEEPVEELTMHRSKLTASEIEEKIVKILRDEENFKEPFTPAKNQTEDQRENQTDQSSSEESYDALSGIWRQLTTECEGKDFIVSHPNFNAFRQDDPHWLEQQSLSYEAMDASIQKCREWLQTCENLS